MPTPEALSRPETPADPSGSRHGWPTWARQLVPLALWLGIATAVGELLIYGGRHWVLADPLRMGPHFIWTTPLTDGVLFLLVGLTLSLAARLFPRQVGFRGALFLLLLLSAFSWLLALGRIALWAGLLLGGAVAWRLSGALADADRQRRLDSLVQRSLLVMVLGIALVGGGVSAWLRWTEHRRVLALAGAQAGTPNILLIVLDTVGANWMSGLGYDRPTTPRIDSFATQGTSFERAIATSSWTLPTHGSMFTGHYAYELNATWNTPLDATYPTLAERLTAAGFNTVGIVANQSYATPDYGLARGFIRYDAFPLNWQEVLLGSAVGRWLNEQKLIRDLVGYHDIVARVRAPVINQRFLEWLDRSPGRPFFAFLNYFDTHEPYHVPAPWDTTFGPALKPDPRTLYGFRYVDIQAKVRKQFGPAERQAQRNAYDATLVYLDHHVGALLDDLQRRGILDSTIVIVTADHGEALGEGGRVLHGEDLNSGAVRVPLIIRYPKRVPAGLRVAETVTMRDLAATIADLAGVSRSVDLPGQSLARVWAPDKPPATSPVVLSLRGYNAKVRPWFGLVEGNWHYIVTTRGKVSLYNLATDPLELDNLAGGAADSAVADTLWRKLAASLRGVEPARPAPPTAGQDSAGRAR